VHSLNFWLRVLLPLAMVASHPDMLKPSTIDESELLKLVENNFLPDHAAPQWWPTKGEDIPTPNNKQIVVLTSFSNADSSSPHVISSAVFCTTIRLN
jgi:hypothetical protein